jgi:hypothetical protein
MMKKQRVKSFTSLTHGDYQIPAVRLYHRVQRRIPPFFLLHSQMMCEEWVIEAKMNRSREEIKTGSRGCSKN